MESNPVLEAALDYADRGWRIIPLRGKIPTIKDWPSKASTNHEQICQWFCRKGLNVGIATGQGLAVLDIDGMDGLNTLRSIVASLPRTLTCETGRGLHLYFSCDGPVVSWDAPGLELKGDGRQVVAPPSKHASGRLYRWVDPAVAMAPLPVELLAWGNGRNFQKPSAKYSDTIPAHLANSRMGRIADRATTGAPASPEELDAVAQKIPNEDAGWEEWNRHGMAFWRASEGNDDGLKAFIAWSSKSNKHDEQTCVARWNHYHKSPPTEIGMGTLVYEARQADPSFDSPPKQDESDESYAESEQTQTKSGSEQKPLSPLEQLNKEYCVIYIGGKATIMSWRKSHWNYDIPSFQTFKSFSEWHMNKPPLGSGKKKVPLATAWFKWAGRRTYTGLELCPPGCTPQAGFMNLWRGYAVEPRQGSWALMKAHIRDVLASGNDDDAWYIIRWVAWAIQNPGKPAEVALVLRGGKGTGKGAFASALVELFGAHGLQVNSSQHLVGHFNAHLRDCILLFADEAFWAGDKQGELALKRILTEQSLAIEAKGFDVQPWTNRLHIIMAANADWVVPASHDERRYAVFNVADSKAWDRQYFEALYHEIENGGLAAMLHDLSKLELGSWHPRQLPQNLALHDQKLESLPILEKWARDQLEEGYMPNMNDKNECPAGALYEEFRKMRGTERITQTAFGIYLRNRLGAMTGRKTKYRFWVFPNLIEARKRWLIKYPLHKWQEELTEW